MQAIVRGRLADQGSVATAAPLSSTTDEKYAPGILFRVRVFCLQRLFRLESEFEIALFFCKIEHTIKESVSAWYKSEPFLIV